MKYLSLLITILIFTTISYGQESIGLNNSINYIVKEEFIDKYDLIRSDNNGNVIWEISFNQNYFSFDTTLESYIVIGHTEILNGKIISNPYDYDYWFVSKKTDDHILIFPNPTFGFLNVFVDNIKNGMNLELYDQCFRLIKKERIYNFNNEIDLNNYSKGVYFLKVMNDNEILKFEKICLL